MGPPISRSVSWFTPPRRWQCPKTAYLTAERDVVKGWTNGTIAGESRRPLRLRHYDLGRMHKFPSSEHPFGGSRLVERKERPGRYTLFLMDRS